MALTGKQQRFVDEYLIDLNATQAYIRAGYTAKGNSAEVNANRLLRNAKVQECIQKAMDERSHRTQITADRVLEEYAKIGFSNITDYLKVSIRERTIVIDGPNGPQFDKDMVQGVDLYDTDEIDPEKMRAVAEIKQTKEGIALKLHDKKGALDSIARHLGMFKDRIDISGNINHSFEDKLRELMNNG